MSNQSMKAIRYHDYGGPEVLVLEDAPRPQPKENQVLVRILASGVNPADSWFRSGAGKQFVPLQFPHIPGLEGAGTVAELGAGVTTLKVGQPVFGRIDASNAEYAVAPATDLLPQPASLSFEQAASVPMGALTAWAAVIEAAKVDAGQRVLVQGGAGGVGLYAVQLAKWKGAKVYATSSAKNIDFVRSLGAEPIDYNAVRFEAVVRDLDVVVDTVGDEIIERSWQVLRPNGVLVTVAGRLSPEDGEKHGVRTPSVGRPSGTPLGQIAELIESKKIKPQVGAVFPLAQAKQAHELSQTGHGRGRIVLRVGDSTPR
jgi:NADPH:quinone reductase-like Zn-dependent oxidoreductase